MGRLDNKIAVVTGATSGIGQGTAIMFAKEGAKVVAVGRNADAGAETLKTIKDAGGDAIFLPVDLRDRESVAGIKAAALEAYGAPNVLFNAAGVLVHKPFLEHNDDDLDLIMTTNFRPYVWLMQEFIPGMIEQGGGSIVNVASISSVWPEINSYYYGAMKAAVSNISRNVAKEFARQKIRVNVICPGPVLTGMTPDKSPEMQAMCVQDCAWLGRVGVPDDIAYAATYFASDESSWVTGAQLVVDGGTCVSN